MTIRADGISPREADYRDSIGPRNDGGHATGLIHYSSTRKRFFRNIHNFVLILSRALSTDRIPLSRRWPFLPPSRWIHATYHYRSRNRTFNNFNLRYDFRAVSWETGVDIQVLRYSSTYIPTGLSGGQWCWSFKFIWSDSSFGDMNCFEKFV